MMSMRNVWKMSEATARTYRHVLGRPGESTRTRADELARNAKVTKLDYALP